MHSGIRNILFIGFLLSSFFCSAQEFGGNPSSLKWNQINTDTARVIFPVGLEASGRKVASIIHDLQKNHTATIGNKLKKINIVLQNQTTISNAYVGLGPFRAEFYLFAPQNSFELGAINWAEDLSMHEYRHVEQYNNFNVGLSKAAGILFGQDGQAFANAASVPDWFFEGDAVFNETALTDQGRGRLPNFFNGYQSLFREGKHYSYMKLRNGSYRNYVPNHYNLGYLLVAYGREKYGADFWRKVTHDAAAFHPLIYPWQGALKRYAGISYKQFVKDAFNFYDSKWSLATGDTLNYITPSHNTYVTNYKYPYIDHNGSLIALKTSYRKIPAFYKINADGSEHKIAVRDIANDDYFSYNNGKIVYASFKADVRWGYREFSDIKVLDVATGEIKKVTNKERFFSPDISHDGQKIVTVQMRTNQVSELIGLNMNGETLFRSKAARGVIYTYPKFSANDSFIYAAVRNEEGDMSLLKIEMSTGKETRLIPYSNKIIGFPTVQADTIFFTSSYKGSDEIWAFVESAGKTFRVAVNPTGCYQAVYDRSKNRLITSSFTANGYRLAAVDHSSLLWQAVNEKENALPDLYVPEALRQENKNTFQDIPVRDFAVSRYNKGFNLLNFHSWIPYYNDPEFGISLYGENILNTLQTELFYTYNRNEKSHKAGFNSVYGGWFIQPMIGVNQTWDRSISLSRDTTLYYKELNANAGLRLPLNFSAGKQYRYLTASATINNQNVKGTGYFKNFIKSQSFNFWEGTLQYQGQIQKAVQQIYPRWGQTFIARYRSIVNRLSANQLLLTGSIYLPGFFINHNIVLTGAYQQRDTLGQYYFSNSFPFSRGYPGIDFPRMWRLGSNYHLPLVYPDWGFGNIVYFKRVRANGFYDISWLKSLRTGNVYNFKTVGIELFFDTRWWNQQDVSFGIRYSRLLDYKMLRLTQPNQWEIVLPVGLFR